MLPPAATGIEQREVERAVQKQFGPTTLRRWKAIDLGRGRGDNVTSLGVHRVHGQVWTPGGDLAWSQIRKVFVRPPGAEQAVGHWNYWRREPRLLASGFLSDLPRGVAAPAVYLIDEAVGRVTVWMEDAGPEPRSGLTSQQLVTVAHRLGRIAGRFLNRPPTSAWASRDLVGQWISNLPTYAPLLHNAEAPGWSDTRTRDVYRGGRAGPVATLLSNASEVWTALDRSSLTLCHRDCGLENLRLHDRGQQLVLFDWALAGPGPVGEDLGLLLASAAGPSTGDPLALGRRLLAGYLEGIAGTDAAGAVPAAAIWQTAVTTAALRESIFAAAKLSSAIASTDPGLELFADFAAKAPAIEAFSAEALLLANPSGQPIGARHPRVS